MTLPTTLIALLMPVSVADESASSSSSQQIEVASVVVSAIEQVDVPTLQEGVLVKLSAEEGTHVKRNEVLATIDSRDAELSLERSQLEFESAKSRAASTTAVEVARKTLQLAESDMQRAMKSRELYAKAISDEELDHRRLMIDQAKLQLQQTEEDKQQKERDAALAEVTVKMMQVRLDRHRIKAPVDGVIVEVKRRAGEWTESGQPIARIVRVDRLRAEGFVDAVHLKSLKRGQPVVLTSQAGGETQTFQGILKFVSPEIIAVDGRVRIWAEIDNSKLNLHPGTRATMAVDVSEKREIDGTESEQ